MEPELGLVLVGIGLVAAYATFWGARQSFRLALKYRSKEGKLADFIHESWRSSSGGHVFSDTNNASGHYEASLTRIQGLTTWTAHVALGLAVIAGLWIGMRDVDAGRLSSGDVMVFTMYALMLRAHMVQLARQGTRCGKVFACGDRLYELIASAPANASAPQELGPLRSSLEIRDTRVSARRGRVRHRLLGPLDLRIKAGERVLVFGPPGAGKTTLLELLAGAKKFSGEGILWNGRDASVAPSWSGSSEIAYLSETPTWSRQPLRELLMLGEGELDDRTAAILTRCGLRRLLNRLPRGIDTAISSDNVSEAERRGLTLARVLLSSASLYLLDNPAANRDKRQAKKVIKLISEIKPDATILVTMLRPIKPECFDRVVRLKRGRVTFDGAPSEWQQQKKDQKRSVSKGKSRVRKL